MAMRSKRKVASHHARGTSDQSECSVAESMCKTHDAIENLQSRQYQETDDFRDGA
jgi:hypothetical protein